MEDFTYLIIASFIRSHILFLVESRVNLNNTHMILQVKLSKKCQNHCLKYDQVFFKHMRDVSRY